MNEDIASPPSMAPEAVIGYRLALPGDEDAIYRLIEEASRTTTVLPRSHEAILALLDNFIIAERAGVILGCGALSPFTPHLAEIRSLVVAEGLRGQGVGGGLVQALVAEARRRGAKRVFALTDSPAFFQRLGFALTSKATLPHKVWNECVHCPKFLTCTEEAVHLFLCPGAAAEPGVITLEDPLPDPDGGGESP